MHAIDLEENTSLVTLFAPAKLTLSLHIEGIRSDGYHLIDAEMVTLDFGDVLTIYPGTGLQIVNKQTGLTIPSNTNNLVSKALNLVGYSARVVLEKNIAAGAGLGGGSADAAAILRWVGYQDVAGACQLGADVGFCLLGGRARVQGIGEVITPLPPKSQFVTVITPPFGCSTPEVYKAWDRLGCPTGPHENDLLQAAFHVEPRLQSYYDDLGNDTGQQPHLAGSGSTLFVYGAYPGIGRRVASIG